MADKQREDSENLRELQAIEQNIQSLSLQRQAFDYEESEVEHALEELGKTTGEVFKIVGSIMVKAKKEELKSELERKLKLIQIRVKSIQDQEEEMGQKALKLRSSLSTGKSSRN